MKAWPEDRTIIECGRREVNAFGRFARVFFSRRHLQAVFVSCMAAAFAFGCADDEQKAKRLERKAAQAMEDDRRDDALALYREIVDRYPATASADFAHERVLFLTGLDDAVERFPSRNARDVMIKTARAVHNYRRRHGSYPSSLDALLPRLLSEPSIDPWGRPLRYDREPGGFRLTCLGEDGRIGGEGEARDFVIVNGEFVSNPSGE